MKTLKLLALILTLGGAVLGHAQTAPPVINYQGRLTLATGVIVPDGLTGMRIRIFATASGGSAFWDSGDLSVATKSGTFSILLGSGGMPAMTPLVFALGTVYVEVQPTGQAPLLPRQPIASVPWSFYAQTVSDNSISSVKLTSDQSSLEKVTGGLATISAGRLLINQNTILGSAVLDVKGWIRSDTTDAAHPAQVQFNDIGNNDAGTVGLTSETGNFVGIAGGKGAGWGMVMNTTTGNVGVGTADPQLKLHVGGSAYVSGAFGIGFQTDPNGYPLQLGGPLPGLSFHLNGALNPTSIIRQNGPNEMHIVPGTSQTNGRLIVYSNRTDLNGDFFVNDDTPTKNGPGNTWTVTSDARLKKNIQPLHGSLAKLLGLRGVNYEFSDPSRVPGRYPGFIAQDVQSVFPDWVTVGQDGYLRVGTIGFDALTVEAIREQQHQIDFLKADNQRLKREIAAIWAELKKRR